MSDIDASIEAGERTIVTVDGVSVSVRPKPTLNVQVATGRKGDKGDPGGGFNFTQATPATVWTIAHNLGFFPTITTHSAGGVTMIGTVVNLSVNVLQVSFEVPVAGTARLA